MRPLLPTLSLQVTYQCNIECKHCGPYCSPLERDWMSEEEIKDLVLQASALGARLVAFTGGEPSLLKEKLVRLLRFIKTETKISYARIVTNGKWATSAQRAREILESWQDAPRGSPKTGHRGSLQNRPTINR
jgi:MoaA/NifB/PqqE/SkfB family radical SAM enzyme